jgi:endonuclease YncB( thermonuclease family)
MQNLIIALVSTVAAIQLTTRSQPVLVKSVINGDTITVSTYGRVRLLGIDAPEGSRAAREKLASLLMNRWVHLEQEGASSDVYNHHAAYVLTDDGQCANTVLVREGLARVSARQALARLPELQRAEADAQTARRGMWGNNPRIPSPSYTRKTQKRKKKP